MTDEEFDHIVENYPYPIACSFNRLGTVHCLEPGYNRLKHIDQTAAAITQFLGTLVLCCCRDHAENQSLKLSSTFSKKFCSQLGKPARGCWMQFAREGLGWLLTTSGPPNELADQLANFFFKRPPKTAHSEGHKALDRLINNRNQIEHGDKQTPDISQIAADCVETYSDLVLVLRSLSFLENYELDFVAKIEVNKRRKQPPQFIHTRQPRRGDQGGYRCKKDLPSSIILENRSVLFRNSRTGYYLNLDPLLVHEEKVGKAEDLFFFNGMESSASIRYVACKQGGGFNSSTCDRRDELDEEMRILLRVLAPTTEVNHGE